MSAFLRGDTSHNYSEYLRWPEDQRYELIQGIAYATSSASSRLHQQFVINIARQLADVLEEGPCEVNIAPFDVRLAVEETADEAIDTVVQPDIFVVCDTGKLDERGCLGAPDWVIEIISPASAAHDQIRKRELYERFGVREYWIVHPIDRLVTVYVLDKEAYGRPDINELKGHLSSSRFPQVVVDWERVTQRLLPSTQGRG